MIHNIIFDMGNVIMHYDPLFFCRRVASTEEEAHQLLQFIFQAPEWAMLDAGTISVDDFAGKLRERVPSELLDKALDVLYNWHINLPVYPAMDDLMAELKDQGLNLYLLSNAGLQFHTYSKHIPAFRHLDGIVISADLQMTKPHPDIFQYLLQKYNLNADECLFIDDIEANTKGAEAVGIHGYCYADGNITRLRRYLEQQHIL